MGKACLLGKGEEVEVTGGDMTKLVRYVAWTNVLMAATFCAVYTVIHFDQPLAFLSGAGWALLTSVYVMGMRP